MRPPIKKKTGLLKYQAGGNPYANWRTPGYDNYMKSGMMNLDRKGTTTAGGGDASGGGSGSFDNASTAINAIGGALGSLSSMWGPDKYGRYKEPMGTGASIGQEIGDTVGSIVPWYGAFKGASSFAGTGADAAEDPATREVSRGFEGTLDPFGTHMNIISAAENGFISKKDVPAYQALSFIPLAGPAISNIMMGKAEDAHYEDVISRTGKNTNVGGRNGTFGSVGKNFSPSMSNAPGGLGFGNSYNNSGTTFGRNPYGGSLVYQTGGRYQTGGGKHTPFQDWLSHPNMVNGKQRNPQDTLIRRDPREFDFNNPEMWGKVNSRSNDDIQLGEAFTKTYGNLSSMNPNIEGNPKEYSWSNKGYDPLDKSYFEIQKYNSGVFDNEEPQYRLNSKAKLKTGGYDSEPNAELEGGEVIERTQGRDKHIPKSAPSHEEGGTDETLGRGDFVWSDHLKYNGRSFADWYKSLKEANISDSEKALAIEELRGMQEQQAGRVGTPTVNEEGMLLAQTGIPTPVSVDPRVNAQGPTREDMYALLGQEEASKFRTDEILRDYHAQNIAAYNTKNGLGPDAGAKALAEAKANPDYFKNQPANTKTDDAAKRSKTGEFINRYGHYAGLALGPLGAIIGASLQKPFDYDVPAPPNFGRSPVHLSRVEKDLTAERAAASKAMDTLKRAGKSVNLNSDLNTVQRGLAEMASKEKGRVDQLNLGQAGNEAEMNQRDAQLVQQLTAEYGDRYATRRIEKEAANTMFKNQRVADVVGAIGEAGKMGTYYAAQERAADAYRGPETGLTDRTYGYKYNFENWKKANPKGTRQEWIASMAAEMNKA